MSILSYMYNLLVIITKLMKNEIFSYTLAARLERNLSIGSCDGYIDVYFKSYILS